MNKQPEVTEATRAAIVEAFCDLYRERPVERITVKEVAARAGYSRATYYKYFSDNYELLDYVEESLMDTALSKMGELMSQGGDWAGSFVGAFASVADSTRPYASVLAGPVGAAHFAARARKEVVPRLMAALGVDETDGRARTALEFHAAGLSAALGYWLSGGWDVPAEKFAHLVRGILNEGVLAQIRP